MQRKSIMPFESPDVPVIHRLSHELRSLDEYLLSGGKARGRSNDMAVALFNDSSKIAQDGIPLTVGRLRRLQNDLRSFSLLVDSRIACLKDAHQSLFAGAATLPNEILGHIFLAGCTPDAYGAFFALAVSHVCQKFRAIALSMPSLWTILTNSQTEEQLAMFLERSKSLDLTISINDDPLRRFAEPGRLSLFDFRNLVRRYSDRLAEFRYVSSHNYEEEPDEECEDGEVEIIGYALVGQGFSRLKSVHIITERTFLRVPTIVSLENWTDYLFHLSWRAPALTYFRGVNVLPPYIYTDALTSCSLTFVEKVIPCLTDTLENLENLEKSSLELQSVQASDFELRKVCLPSLQAFALIAGKGTSFSVLQQTTSMLELPSLEELSLTIKLEFTRKNITEALTKAHVFPKASKFPELRGLHLRIFRSKHNRTLEKWKGLEKIFALYPQIHSLHIEAPELEADSLAKLDIPPALRSLTLEHCHSIDAASLGRIVEKLRSQVGWAHFRQLRCMFCNSLAESNLQRIRMLIGNKLVCF